MLQQSPAEAAGFKKVISGHQSKWVLHAQSTATQIQHCHCHSAAIGYAA